MIPKQNTAESRQIEDASKRRLYIINLIVKAGFVSGLILTIFEIHLYRDTIIQWTIPTAIWFFSGLILTPTTSNLFKKYNITSVFFWQLVINAGGFGGLFVYTFIALNYYFPSDKKVYEKVQIIKTGHLAKGKYGCGNPYADVKINDINKELIFPCNIEIEKYKYINLTMKKGLLGFYTVESKTVVTE